MHTRVPFTEVAYINMIMKWNRLLICKYWFNPPPPLSPSQYYSQQGEIPELTKVRITHPQYFSICWLDRELQSQQGQLVGMMRTRVYYARPR